MNPPASSARSRSEGVVIGSRTRESSAPWGRILTNSAASGSKRVVAPAFAAAAPAGPASAAAMPAAAASALSAAVAMLFALRPRRTRRGRRHIAGRRVRVFFPEQHLARQLHPVLIVDRDHFDAQRVAHLAHFIDPANITVGQFG